VHLNRIIFLFFALLSTMGLSSLLHAQKPSHAEAKKADDDCKTQPYAYDNGPYGQGSWCGECTLATSTRQAPININGAQPAPLAPIQFNYQPTPLRTIPFGKNNLKVEAKGVIHIANFEDQDFKLEEFHFHRPSEEAIDNHRSAMVIHLVHANATHTKYVVVSVLVEEGYPAADTAKLLDTLIRHFPPPLGPQGDIMINANDLLPADHDGYFRYDGSLTTPPCTEAVTFFVLKSPIKLHTEQLRQFARRFPLANARDLQETHGRQILERTTNAK
jgi:carbonic anhydrase